MSQAGPRKCVSPLVSDALARLEADLESGAWARLQGDLLVLDSLDCGYRLVVAG